MDIGTGGSCTSWVARPRHSYTQSLRKLRPEPPDSRASAMLATECWEEAEGSRSHGSWGWKRPTWS